MGGLESSPTARQSLLTAAWPSAGGLFWVTRGGRGSFLDRKGLVAEERDFLQGSWERGDWHQVLPDVGCRIVFTLNARNMEGKAGVRAFPKPHTPGPADQPEVGFAGDTEFAPGKWIGVILDTADGKNDGSVKDVRERARQGSLRLWAMSGVKGTVLDSNLLWRSSACRADEWKALPNSLFGGIYFRVDPFVNCYGRDNSPSVQDKQYFTCKPQHGLFVRPQNIVQALFGLVVPQKRTHPCTTLIRCDSTPMCGVWIGTRSQWEAIAEKEESL